MAKNYKKLPSEVLKVENELLAYMVDEFSIYLEDGLRDKEGIIRWDKVYYKDKPQRFEGNEAMKQHILQEQKKKRRGVRKRVGE